jgi:hypothetical protein
MPALVVAMCTDNNRKHRKQMHPGEIAAVEGLVNSEGNWNIGPHATKKMADKGITTDQVIETLALGYVVEVNHNNDLCAVFRKEYGRFAVCVVVNLPTRWVVTVWKNGARDTHATLDHSKYLWKANIETVMAAFA